MDLRIGFLQQVLIILTLSYLQGAAANRYNITMAEMDTCKEYDIDSKHGYAYKRFFQVHSLDNNQIEANERLHLKFYVLTSMDAHILLAVNDRPRGRDRVYEIVIGAGMDTFSAIRTNMGLYRVATSQYRDILSRYEPTPIEIVQTKDAHLVVYIPGLRPEPLLNFTDSMPLTINYISFSSFGTMSAKWFYDCKFDGFENEMEEEITLKTPRQRLVANLTAKAQNQSIPLALQAVNFAFQVRSLSYNQETSMLNTRMNMVLYWKDPNLAWDPRDYNEIDLVVQPSLAIWTPTVVAINGKIEWGANEMHVHADGNISMHATNVEILSRCVNTKRNWPDEKLSCEIVLGLSEFVANPTEQLLLEYDSSRPFSQDPISMLSEWQFTNLQVSRIESSTFGRYTAHGIAQTMDGDLVIEFGIEHNSNFYKNVFTLPLYAGQSLLMLSFLLRGYRRGALILVVFLIVIMGLMFVTKHGPHSYVPNVTRLYQHMLHMGTFCYMLHIVIMWLELYPPKYKPWNWLMSALTLSFLRVLFCLRLSDCNSYANIEQHPWRELAKVINNIAFVLLSVAFVILAMLNEPTA